MDALTTLFVSTAKVPIDVVVTEDTWWKGTSVKVRVQVVIIRCPLKVSNLNIYLFYGKYHYGEKIFV